MSLPGEEFLSVYPLEAWERWVETKAREMSPFDASAREFGRRIARLLKRQQAREEDGSRHNGLDAATCCLAVGSRASGNGQRGSASLLRLYDRTAIVATS